MVNPKLILIFELLITTNKYIMSSITLIKNRLKKNPIIIDNDDTRGIAILITEELIAEGIIKDYEDDMDEDDIQAFNTQDAIHRKINELFNVESDD